ncbi:hypothetical protein EMCRGX_G012308 [Ephydatia muelleri]
MIRHTPKTTTLVNEKGRYVFTESAIGFSRQTETQREAGYAPLRYGSISYHSGCLVWIGSPESWPDVTYLLFSPSPCTKDDRKAYKSTEAWKYVTSGYVSGIKLLKISADLCLVTAKVKHSSQKMSVLNMVYFIFPPKSTILLASNSSVCVPVSTILASNSSVCVPISTSDFSTSESCRLAHLSVKVESRNNLTPDHSHTRPADVLIQNWSRGRPAAFDICVTSPLNTLTLSERGFVQVPQPRLERSGSTQLMMTNVEIWSEGITVLASMALAMALTRVIFNLPNMSLITLALRNEEEPKAKRVASRAKVPLASSPQLQ